jgi:acyl-coenzyme A thioesterase PaaI-like protein
MKRRTSSDGAFHCTHGIALSLFAETIGGLAVFSRLGPKGRGILVTFETEYVKKAKGLVRVQN